MKPLAFATSCADSARTVGDRVFGGSLITTWAYIFALYASIEAFGGGIGFAAVGVAFLCCVSSQEFG